MKWYVATIADRATLEVLLENLRAELSECRDDDRLGDAQAYVVGAGTVVRIYLNETARLCIGMLAGLALMPSDPPLEREKVRSVLEPPR